MPKDNTASLYPTNATRVKLKQKYTKAEKQLKLSSSNKIAKELKDRRYHQRVVRSKKVYDRKKINENTYRDSEWDLS